MVGAYYVSRRRWNERNIENESKSSLNVTLLCIIMVVQTNQASIMRHRGRVIWGYHMLESAMECNAKGLPTQRVSVLIVAHVLSSESCRSSLLRYLIKLVALSLDVVQAEVLDLFFSSVVVLLDDLLVILNATTIDTSDERAC